MDTGYKTYHSGEWHYFNKPDPKNDSGFDKSYYLNKCECYFHGFDLISEIVIPEGGTN